MLRLFLILLVAEEAFSRIKLTFFSKTKPAQKIFLKPLTQFLLILYLFIFFGSLIYHFLWVPQVNPWVSALGGICFACAVALRTLAIKTLGPYWSFYTEIKVGHELVETGPFFWIRHPYYLAVMMELGGFALLTNAWPFFFLTLMGPLPLLWYRSRKEEEILLEFFQDRYTHYARRRGAFLPRRFFRSSP